MTARPATSLGGIHHLTAVSADAQRTADFYTAMLGLRLFGQTVDLADPSVLHFAFGGEEKGSGVLSFLVRPGAPRGKYGIGGTHHLAFETSSRNTLLQWKRWLSDHGIPISGPYDRVYFESIYFADPDGLILEIASRGPGWTVDEAPDALGTAVKLPPRETTAGFRDEAAISATIWPEPIAAPTGEMRLRRMHHVTAIGSDAARTEHFFADVLGMRTVKRTVNFDDPSSPHLYFGIGDGLAGTIVTYFAYPHGTMRPVRAGAGMTHHFALSVPDETALDYWREYLNGRDVRVSEIADHLWYRGIALLDPNGHIIEIAMDKPGFRDEPESALGKTLHLPELLEPKRDELTRNLQPLIVRIPLGR